MENSTYQLEDAALVKVENLPNVVPSFLQFHPTLLPYLASKLTDERRIALEKRYWQHYSHVANYLYQEDSQSPIFARMIALRDMPNLRCAFELALNALTRGEIEATLVIDLVSRLERFLRGLGRRREFELILAKLTKLNSSHDAGIGVTKAYVSMEKERGESLRQRGLTAQAEEVFRNLLAKMDTGTAYESGESDFDRGYILWALGQCLKSQSRSSQSIQVLHEAMEIFKRLSESSLSAKRNLSGTYSDLGDNYVELRKLDEAQAAYEAGLKIDQELGSERSIAVGLEQLGILALHRGQFKEARQSFFNALETFHRMGEPESESIAWYQLGRVGQEEKMWDEAERCFRECLKLTESLSDKPRMANTFNALAVVAKNAGRFADAEQWYWRSVEIHEQLQDIAGLALVLHNWAILCFQQDRLDEACKHAERASVLKEGLDLSASSWNTYGLLCQIAQKRGRSEEAMTWRRKANESQDAYVGTRYEYRPKLEQFQSLITVIVAVARGNQTERTKVESAVEARETKGWHIADPIRRIWAGERDADSLTASLDYEDRAIVLAILHRLGVAVPTWIAEVDDQLASGDSETIKRILQNFQSLIAAVVIAANGDQNAKAEVEDFLPQLAEKGWQITDPINRIWAGEREAEALTAGLDSQDAVIIKAILAQLSGQVVPATSTSDPISTDNDETETSESEPQDLTIDQLFDLVASATRKDAPAGLGEALLAVSRQMSTAPNLTEEGHALGRILSAILSGDRKPDLSGLSPELTEKVQSLLQSLTNP